MTIEAKKRAKVRRSRVPLGEMRRGPGGEVEMIEFLEYRRNPAAPTIFVNKAAGIYRVGSDLIKVTFAQTLSTAGGIPDTTETISLIWPQGDWHEAGELFRWAFQEMRRGTFH